MHEVRPATPGNLSPCDHDECGPQWLQPAIDESTDRYTARMADSALDGQQ